MLKLINITKDYKVADTTVRALKGISLSFRQNEFVSVLGPSGCGKTTLLNLIGGLDKCTSGDLIINGKGTRRFKDKDWDVYRNRRVGFIFQSYNLIPHQNVLSNVELALTIAGMGKAERAEKAKRALDKVGLSDQYYKRPNQLSGGQCQRVAIARALVNDPEILLADEPTGALDTKTSEQIMGLVKEIAKERLVIMVTHNSELAAQYSTRIVKLLDGELQSDSNPFSDDDEAVETAASTAAAKATSKPKGKERAKMSFGTAFKLSLQNLFSKRKRTVLTSFASSIGIIGISLVLSISYGMQTFISQMQNDMLSGNPITVTETALNLQAMMSQTTTQDQINIIKENGYVNVDAMVSSIIKRALGMSNIITQNNITQAYVDYVEAMPAEYAAAIFLDYGIDITNNIYTDFYESATAEPQNISLGALRTIYTAILQQNEATKPYAGLITGLTDIFQQAPDNDEYILTQYDLLDGKIARAQNEVMIVVEKDSMMTDLLLAQLGYYNQEEFINMVYKATDDDRYDPSIPERTKFSYEELTGKTFTWYPNNTVFNAQTDNTLNPFTYNAYSKNLAANNNGGIPLTIVGILEPKEEISYGCLTSGFYYTEELTNHIIATNSESEIVRYLADRDGESDSFTSMYYEVTPNMWIAVGITFSYSFNYSGIPYENQTGFVGSSNSMMSIMSGMMGINVSEAYTLTSRELGGKDIASMISVYPPNLEQKKFALEYLDAWNGDEDLIINGVVLSAENREEINYSDSLSLIFGMISSVINMITIALIGFTTLALVVSCVMIAIITYISVVERTKEIGVIRSLGGRKRDVANLFTAETVIIGLAAGLIAILFTYIASAALNLVTNTAADITIAIFPWFYAALMVTLSVGLTLMSGFIPSRSAAKKDPVVALRTE